MWGKNQNCAVVSMRGKIMISAHKGSTRILYIYTNNMYEDWIYSSTLLPEHILIPGRMSMFLYLDYFHVFNVYIKKNLLTYSVRVSLLSIEWSNIIFPGFLVHNYFIKKGSNTNQKGQITCRVVFHVDEDMFVCREKMQ